MLCGNMTGTDNQQLMVIGKSQNHVALKMSTSVVGSHLQRCNKSLDDVEFQLGQLLQTCQTIALGFIVEKRVRTKIDQFFQSRTHCVMLTNQQTVYSRPYMYVLVMLLLTVKIHEYAIHILFRKQFRPIQKENAKLSRQLISPYS